MCCCTRPNLDITMMSTLVGKLHPLLTSQRHQGIASAQHPPPLSTSQPWGKESRWAHYNVDGQCTPPSSTLQLWGGERRWTHPNIVGWCLLILSHSWGVAHSVAGVAVGPSQQQVVAPGVVRPNVTHCCIALTWDCIYQILIKCQYWILRCVLFWQSLFPCLNGYVLPQRICYV